MTAANTLPLSFRYQDDPWSLITKRVAIPEPLPLGTILTLAATGSEMNGVAVISNDETGEKLPLSDQMLRPKFSILDPVLTFSVSKKQTAAGVADIMSHIFEQYFINEPGTDVSDRVAEALLKVCITYGPVVMAQPENYEARANLMWASSLALNGLLQLGKGYGDWATHSIEHELSACNDMTHGVGLAILTPAWMNYVLDESNAPRFAALGRNVFDVSEENDLAAAEKTIRKVRDFFIRLGLPVSLKEVNITSDKIDELAAKTVRFSGYVGVFKKTI